MINNLFYMSGNALLNAQYAISTHSNNITNANTPGYTRRSVVLENTPGINSPQGELGTGANIQSLLRHLDVYLQQRQMEADGNNAMWSSTHVRMQSVEALFGTGNSSMNSAFDTFWNAWSELTSNPDNQAKRETLIQHSKTLLTLLGTTRSGLETERDNLNKSMEADVTEANNIMEELATVNTKLAADPDNHDLQDRQGLLLSNLSKKLDITISNAGTSRLTVMTKQGQTLVTGSEHYSLKIHEPYSSSNIDPSSNFDGKIYFEGSSGHELKIDFTSNGPANGSSGAATFRVSLDGGKTWVTNADGSPKEFTAGGKDDPVTVDGVTFWFGTESDPSATPSNNVAAEDSFTIVPKKSIHWHRTTSESVNITPLTNDPDGFGNRLSGGSLASSAMVRDYNIRNYLERLDRLANELIWQVNFQHSQGAGLKKLSHALSDHAVKNASLPLSRSGLAYAENIQSGAISFAIYDASNGSFLEKKQVDFSSIVPPGVATFDPAQHSLNDVAAAINASFPDQMTAKVSNGQLQLTSSNDTKKFHFAGDTSGIMAAMGLNTYFQGDGLNNIALGSAVLADPNRINAAHVNGAGEVNLSDKEIAQNIFALATKKILFSTPNGSETNESLNEFLHALTGRVGLDTLRAKNNATIASTLKKQLDTTQAAKSGVNTDEEYTRVMQWNKNFQTASKLIQTANQMFDTILSLKN